MEESKYEIHIHAPVQGLSVGNNTNVTMQYQDSPVSLSNLLPQDTTLFMFAKLPANFLARLLEFRALKQSILFGQRERPTAITIALRRPGGYGKTTLARALCYDSDIQETFRDGILWVTLGEQPINLIGQIEDLVYLLSRERSGFTSLVVSPV